MDNRFIALEGQDGTGKATQLELLKKRLPNAKTIALPQYGQPSAYFVENYLKGAYGVPTQVNPYQAASFYALDRYDAALKVEQWLAKSEMVIADRWTMSNVIYQMAKVFIKFGDWAQAERFARWLLHFEHFILKIPKPFYIYFKIPAKISCDMKAKQCSRLDGHETNRAYQNKVTSLYRYMSQVNFCGTTAIIDCVDLKSGKILAPEIIHQKIWEALNV